MNPPQRYAPGTVRALLDTDLVTPPTRAALRERLDTPLAPLEFFSPAEEALLGAVIARLLPQGAEVYAHLLASLDARLARGEGDGWRYAAMPPDGDSVRQGLIGLDQSAQALHGAVFLSLATPQQDDILRRVQAGDAPGAAWQRLNAPRWFEELLADLSYFYFSHPLAQEQFGYVGMADGHGWERIGLNALEAWEPRAEQPQLPLPPIPTAPVSQPEPALPPMRRYATDEIVDVVVIGTGAGGSPLLARLAEAGLHVVALEAGKFWNPARDFATDERAQDKLFWRDERLSAGDDPLAFGGNNSGIGVGGSTLHYTAYTPRPHADDFHLRRDFGVGVDWPLAYADLEPYFNELETFLGVSGRSPYLWEPTRQPYPLAPLPLNGAAQLMQRGCAALGIRTSPAPNAALSAPYYQPGAGWRRACTNRGFCQAGCSVGAKASMDVTFIPRALEAGAEVRAQCFVSGIERGADGRVTGVVYRQDSAEGAPPTEHRQPCRAVFLCAGAVETPRLLLTQGLANSSGQVGRNFMAHPGLQLWGQFDEDIRPYKGIPGALISEDTHRPPDADFAGGYLLQSIGVMPVTYATQLARGEGLWGDALHAHMAGYNHTAGINILGDCLPSERNFLELSDEIDARGLPKPRIHFSNGENERRLIAHAERTMRAIWEQAGAHSIWKLERSAHVIGTCRMGDDPTQSVVSTDGRAHDIPNLYVVDNSVFPSALSVNPALTIMALSLRCADHFIQHARA